MSNFVGVRVLADGLSPCPNPLSRGAAIDPQTSSAHVVFTDLPDGVIREACILRKASICEHNIELALFSLDLGEEAIKIGDVRHLSLYCVYSIDFLCRCRQLRITPPGYDTYAPVH